MLIAICACGKTTDDKVSNDSKDTAENNHQSSEKETEEQQTTMMKFGDTIKTDLFEFTPSFDGYADEVANWPDENYLKPTGKMAGSNPYKADSDKTVMYFSGVVNYIGNEKSNVNFTYGFSVDYDNGYVFKDDGSVVITDGHVEVGYGYTKSLNDPDWEYENTMTFEPLSSETTRYVRFCIIVPKVIETETAKPLNVNFMINGESYTFVLR